MLTVLTSAAGSPGVSTLAMGLTHSWPRSVLLVDADHQQAFLTGHLAGEYPTDRSLLRVIEASRLSHDLREAVWNQAVALPTDNVDGSRRLLLPGLTSPQARSALDQAWYVLARALVNLDRADIDVILDLGRLTSNGIPMPLVESAGQILLVLQPTLREIGAARAAAESISASVADIGATERASMVLRQPPKHVRSARTDAFRRDASRFLGLPVIATLPDDPTAAHWLSDGGDQPPKFARSALHAGIEGLAHTLTSRHRREENIA